MSNEEYIKKWLDGTLTEEEEKHFLQSDDYASIKKMLYATQSFKAPEYNVDAEWDRLSKAKSAKKPKVIRVNWYKPLLQVAASLLILAVAYFFFFYNPQVVVSTLAGEKTEFYLPDSSVVILNAESKISYSEDDWSDSRKVSLQGEAFFKVAKGSKFDVKTTTGTVSVLGTQFNVKDRSSYFEVFCFEGLVQVDAADKVVKLSASKGLKVINDVVSEYDKIGVLSPGWVIGESYFESVPYSQVIQEIRRQYDLNVELNNVDTTTLFTGGFSHHDLPLAIKSITLPMNISYKLIDDKKVVLTGN
ncbi:MAG: FecR family protein [Bacteroidota bacterium]